MRIEPEGVRGWRLALTSGLTAARVAFIPVFLVTVHQVPPDAEGTTLRLVAVGWLFAIGASDVLDGYLARRLGTESRAGAVADALVDKAVQLILVAYFTFEGTARFWDVPLWFLGLVVGRDVVLLGGGLLHLAARKPVPVEHSHYGRAGTVLIFLILVGITLDLPAGWLSAGTALAAAAIAISTTLYAVRAYRRGAVGGETLPP